MLYNILIAVAVVSGIGLICGIVLALASHFMAVKVNEKKEAVRACLPGVNCGACGYTGCDGYAAALVKGDAEVNLCIPGADAVAKIRSRPPRPRISANNSFHSRNCGTRSVY